MFSRHPGRAARLAYLLATALTVTCLAGCTAGLSNAAPLVTTADARTAVLHHWDVNRRALRATSGAEARRLIEQVEGGDALRLDEDVIVREADTRGTTHARPPTIPDSTAIRVFVPRQATYPATFVSVRTQVVSDPTGIPTDKTADVLELFQRASRGDAWRNVGYADIAAGLGARLDLTLDRDGYAAFAQGNPGESELSSLYTTYMTAMLTGHPERAGGRIAAGLLTDQFAKQVQRGLASTSVKRAASFAASRRQDGIKLRTAGGGMFVLFSNRYDVVTTPLGGGCITAGPGSAVPGSYKSVVDHFLQNLGAVVGAGSQGSVTIIAESDSVVSVDSKPCAGDATI